MKSIKQAVNANNNWEYKQAVMQERKQSKQFREQRRSRKGIWTNYSE